MVKVLFIVLIAYCTINYSATYKNLCIQNQTNKAVKIPGSVKAVENFLNWYSKNYKEISRIRLVDNTIEDNSEEVFYRVDFIETEKYLSKLKSSGYISAKYIEKWRTYFKKRDEKFIKLRQKEGPPSGFEFDFILWTQEIKETFNAIENIRFTSVNETGNTSVIEIDIIMNLRFYLTKNYGIWQIDDIENI